MYLCLYLEFNQTFVFVCFHLIEGGVCSADDDLNGGDEEINQPCAKPGKLGLSRVDIHLIITMMTMVVMMMVMMVMVLVTDLKFTTTIIIMMNKIKMMLDIIKIIDR